MSVVMTDVRVVLLVSNCRVLYQYWSGLLVRSVGGERRAWKPSENASWRRVTSGERGHPGDMYTVSSLSDIDRGILILSI
jgi:hypothetical protein